MYSVADPGGGGVGGLTPLRVFSFCFVVCMEIPIIPRTCLFEDPAPPPPP